MTTELAHPAPSRPRVASRQSRGGFRILAARLVLYWERLAPAILPILGVIAAFIIFALLGFWEKTPVWLHWIALTFGVGALGIFFWRDIRPLRWPSRRAAQARIEDDARLIHAPLQSLDDWPSNPALQASPLWRAHLNASAERARAARLNRPRDVLTARDPYGLRYLLTGLLAISFIAAGDQWRVRLAGMIDPTVASAGTAIADLWIEPPAYTGKAPIYLMRAGEEKSGLEAQVNAPEGARVVAQVNGGGRRKLTFAAETGETRADFAREKQSARGELSLEESGLLTLQLGGRTARWPVSVIPDAPPLVAWGADPEANENNLVDISYISEDDYGIAAARLEMRLDPDQPRPLDFPAFDQASLDQARVVDLAAGAGERMTILDLQADPWAGLAVLARIIVEDGASQLGVSEEKPLTLPTRRFFNPLARAVVEQRQTLAVSPEEWRRAGRSFDAVTMAPEVFFDRSTDYLLLRTAFWRVMRQDGEGFDDAVEEFWPLALQLEDEALELARQRLEAAQEALREAIERGAGDEEIARLTEELRQAMDDYLAALAQSGQTREQAGGGDSQQIERSNLDEMLDSIRDLAQSGAGAAARQMLSELENILNNLRLSRGGGGGGSGQGTPGEAGPSGEAGDLIGRQRELADEAFERDRNGEGEAGDDLAEAQGGIGRDLDDLIDQLQQGEDGALDPNGDAARSMGRARNEMREAEEALREGDFEAAADAMERAIANMREGAEGLAREEMRQAGEGQDGERRSGGTDPLGRPVGDAYGQGVEVPEETDAAKTRAIIERLRERLGEPGRKEEEIDYLERLLERF